RFQRGLGVRRFAHHLDLFFRFEKEAQAPEDHRMVIDQEDRDGPPAPLGHGASPPPSDAAGRGMMARTSVPPPRRLRTVTSPPRDWARSRMPMRPKPPEAPAARA